MRKLSNLLKVIFSLKLHHVKLPPTMGISISSNSSIIFPKCIIDLSIVVQPIHSSMLLMALKLPPTHQIISKALIAINSPSQKTSLHSHHLVHIYYPIFIFVILKLIITILIFYNSSKILLIY